MDFDIKSPILGFEDVSKMTLEKIDDIFMRLSNTDGTAPVFVLINPFALRQYDFEVPVAMELLLDLKNSKNILIANIMVMQTPIQNSTINFLAPLVFNFDNKTMAQIVLDSFKYPSYGIAEPISKWYKEGDENPQSPTKEADSKKSSKKDDSAKSKKK
ncbi:flagellar assembly protein FliW [Helicobacter sp. MIT 01-3238]|uniref:flagellar assembly protein FliW n=1 Tax=Helicobacter sp. MIT 01-3238 TaxID=398627 RepID=UPI000E1EC730|nr:flagellar assembly protein FliW [Helicobacter sp. MIT 01-3238]RDU54513.1 flagellar biosynthesis protein FliW [Helicobacter sp. MIT 01-3238]